ncbi:hypothetical protein GCM10027176_32440 [Actinoallomurus bryophytorum]
MPDVSETPSGWYDDPYGTPGLLRWWDGGQWTEETERAQGPQPAPLYDPPVPLYGQPEPPYGQVPVQPARRNTLPWVLAGGAGLVAVVVAIVAVMFIAGDDGDGGSEPTASPSVTASASASATAQVTRSAVIGTVTDGKAGISYDRLGPPWTPADSGWLRTDMFSGGQVSVVQEPFEQYESFNATSLSGVPRAAESAGYTGPQNLSTVDRNVTARIMHENFDLAADRTPIFSGARAVDGHQAWLERFRLDFTAAKTRHWKFSADTVAIMVVDLGNRRLGELWVSIPDTFANQGDLDQVLDSVKVG